MSAWRLFNMRNPIDCDILVITTHPVQYHAPVYKAVTSRCGLRVHTIYGSDFSIAGYFDDRFKTTFAWDADLVSGEDCTFLARVSEGGARSSGALSAKGLSKALKDVRLGAVLLTGYSGRFHIRAFYEVVRRGYPVLFRAETTDHTVARSHLKSWIRDTSLRWLYSRCQRLLPVGDHSRRHYLRLGCPEAKLFFSPYCVDTAHFQCGEDHRAATRPGVRQTLGVADQDIAVLFVGKLYRHKGVHVLVDAIKRLPAEERDRVAVIVVGDGEERRALEEQAGFGMAPVRVRFVGFKNQHELSPYYHAADLLALPSRSETWGLVVNEALHHGVPCVVTDTVGCAADLVDSGVTGEIGAANSVDEFARALRRGFALVGRSGIRAQCRAKVDSYTVPCAADGIAEAYRSLRQPPAAKRG
jgi:glycosyltransferase involved in cell wall biosynthesis